MVLGKIVTSTKVIITYLGILVVRKNEVVVYIFVKPFEF